MSLTPLAEQETAGSAAVAVRKSQIIRIRQEEILINEDFFKFLFTFFSFEI